MKRTIAAISMAAALTVGPVPTQAADTPAAVPGFKYVRTVGSVQYTLEANGLTVLRIDRRRW
jgi:hypothetical protein